MTTVVIGLAVLVAGGATVGGARRGRRTSHSRWSASGVTFHYFTDTVGGVLLGTSIVCVAALVARRDLTRVNPAAIYVTAVVNMKAMTATPDVDCPPIVSRHHPQSRDRRRRRDGALDRPRRRAAHRRGTAAGAARVGGARRQGPCQGAGPLRRVDGRAPRRDRGAADQGDRQVGDRRRARGAAAHHDRLVLHQDDGEGAGAGDSAGVAAVPEHQEGHGALPAASRRRHRRAVELPRGQSADGRHRGAGGRLRGAAQAVRAHSADRRTVAARLDRLRRPRGHGDRAGRPRGRRGGRRQRRLRPVHRVVRDGRQGGGARGAPAHARSAWNSAARTR